MSNYGIVRVEKSKSGDVVRLQKHINREKESYQNPDIDKSRSDQNYSLIHCEDFKKEIAHEIEELHLKRAVRKDANVMLNGILTASPDFFQNECEDPIWQRDFFESGIRALEKMGWHIFSAEVHMDETTPHMHFCSVPITEDGRLSAKEIVGNREKLSAFQDHMYEECFKWQGLARGVKSSGIAYKSLNSYKRETEKEVTALEVKRMHLSIDIDEKQKQLEEMEEQYQQLQRDAQTFKENLQRDVDAIKEQLREDTQAILDGYYESKDNLYVAGRKEPYERYTFADGHQLDINRNEYRYPEWDLEEEWDFDR